MGSSLLPVDDDIPPWEKAHRKICNDGISSLDMLNEYMETKFAWLDTAYEDAVLAFTGKGNSKFPKTPQVNGKRGRKRKKDIEEKENENIRKEVQSFVKNGDKTPLPKQILKEIQPLSAVKEKVKVYEENNLPSEKKKTLNIKSAQDSKTIVEKKIEAEAVFVSTLSPVLLKSAEKKPLTPRIVQSPLLETNPSNTSRRSKRLSMCRAHGYHQSSVIGTMLRSSITRPSLRRSSLMLSKIRASLRLDNAEKCKRHSEMHQRKSEEKQKNDSTLQCKISGDAPVKEDNLESKTVDLIIEAASGDSTDKSSTETDKDIISRTPSPVLSHRVTKEKLKHSSLVKKGAKRCMYSGSLKKNWNLVNGSTSKKKISSHLPNGKFSLTKPCGTPGIFKPSNQPHFSPKILSTEKENYYQELMKQRQQKEQEVLKRREFLLQQKIIEGKRKREERMLRAQEIRDEMKKKNLEQIYKLEKEQVLKEKMRVENIQQEALKRSQRIKNAEIEKKKKQEEIRLKKQKKKEETLKLKELRAKELAAQREQEQQRVEREKEELERIKENERKIKENAAEENKLVEKEETKTEDSQLNRTFKVNENTCTSYAITPERSCIPQPLVNPDNYDISHLRSDESTDDETEPRKEVPAWAQGHELKALVIRNCIHPPDLDALFPPFAPPDLSLIFKFKRKRFYNRTSSALWSSPIHSHLKKSLSD